MTPTHRTFVSYIDKSREYYAAQGYTQPYRWVRRPETPFSPLRTPLGSARIGVVTTATVHGIEPKRLYTAPTDPAPQSMQTRHLQWHQLVTHTDDAGSFLPLDHLHRLAEEGVIGSVAPRFYGAPTVYSERRTETNAAAIGEWARLDEVDLVLLIPL
jgi:D-proline reductase (dithiol) PrdB